jgi:predicted DCC family thiol-disulfide oxidoreductase YuxK
MQFGFNSAMRLGFFGMIAATTILGMLPSEFWDTIVFPLVKKWKYRGTPNLTIVYDYDCSFCHKISFLIARILLLHPSTAIVSSDQHTMGKGIMEKEDSWVVMSGNGAVTTGFRGFLTVLSHSPSVGFLAPFFSISPVATLGEYIYRFVARRRKLVCLPEPEEKPRGVLFSIVKNGAATFFILLAIGWNLESLGYGVVPDSLRKFALLTRMDQKFNMFAPTPLVEDGWYVMPGTLRNHTEIDVFSGKSPVSYEKPRWVAYTYKDQRWQKYLMNLWSSDLSEFRLGYGQYICRIWNTKHMNTNEELLSFDIIFMVERTPPPGSKQTPIEPTPIWHHECF